MAVDVKTQRKIIGETFFLTQLDGDVTAKTDAEVENFACRYTYAPIWTYQVPVGQEFLLTPEHRASIYLEDDEVAPAEWRDDQKVRIEVWDATKRRMWVVLQGRYEQSKDESDRDKMAHLELFAPLHLRAGDLIYICGYCWKTVFTIDVSDSRFSLEITRVRPSIY